MSDFTVPTSDYPTPPAPILPPPSIESNKEEVPPTVEEPRVLVDGINVTLLKGMVKVYADNGVYKLISYDDFLESIRTTSKESDSTKILEEYWLPTGTFYIGVGKSHIKLSCYFPECHKNLTYRGITRKSVFPNVIISFFLIKTGSEYKVENSSYFVTRDPLGSIPRGYITGSNGYPPLPFTNVYADGRLCFGSAIKVSRLKLPDLRGLYSYYDLLSSSQFNDDLGLGSLKSNYRNRDYVHWYKYLETLAESNKPFPYNELSAY